MQVNILISSAGRRVSLMNCFRESLAELGISGRIVAVDATPYSAAVQLADNFYLVPRCTDPQFIPEIQQICEQEQIQLVVPTIDTELPAYAAARDCFRKQGTQIVISSSETVRICYDKILTHEWLVAQGFPVPRQAAPEVVLRDPRNWVLPLIIKPVDGSGSLGVRMVSSFAELASLAPRSNGIIVQECVEGAEHTINVFVDRQGRCLCAVPHFRMEVRGGEVSKGVTVKNAHMMELASAIVETMPGAYGALNVQCFSTPSGELKVIEINARFGGGYPLAHRAGAPVAKWLVEEIMGREPHEVFDDWEDGLTMLRYDEAVFVPRASLQASDRHAASAQPVSSGPRMAGSGARSAGFLTSDLAPVKQISRHKTLSSSARLVRACSPEWDEYLTRVPHDFFHTAKYHAFSADANGEPWLLVYGGRDKFVAWPYVLQAIDGVAGVETQFRDVTSVYGYSGPVIHNCAEDKTFLANAWQAILDAWRAQMVVSVFTRFHPILANQTWLRSEWTNSSVLGNTYKEGKTVAIDLSKSPDEIWAGYQRKLRQQIRRVEREQQFTIVHDPEWQHLDDFISMYYATLQRNNAAPFYFFSRNYFLALKDTLGPHGSLFLCTCADTISAALLMIEYGGIASVHLAASHDRSSSLSPNKWFFHGAQILARSRGNKFLHIGGGRGSRDDDPLFRFKAQFSNTHLPFYTGRWVLDSEVYDLLAAERRREARLQGDSYLAPTYFPIYRAPLINAPVPRAPTNSPSSHESTGVLNAGKADPEPVKPGSNHPV